MRKISIKNKKLIKTLNTFSDNILNSPIEVFDNLPCDTIVKYDSTDCEKFCSYDYLNERRSKPVMETAFPLHAYGFDMNVSPKRVTPDGWEETKKILDDGVMDSIGVGFSALKMYYPITGFIAWHNNCNCPGQNLLMTYSKYGNGYFEYLDLLSDKIIRIEDLPGWTAKVGYYGSDKEPDKIMWHCAKTYEPRLTVSYVIRDQSMWEEMVQDIQSFQ